jgi:serine/threonine-protein kinase
MGVSFGVGDVVDGKYRILRTIGEGGWGVVFEGENIRALKRVAIKILRTQAGLTPEVLARFEREAQAAGRIGSEHIVEVFDLGLLPDGTHYMVMELLAGENLGQRLQARGALDPIVAVKLMLQLLDGLSAAHKAGIVHRDLKPENLFLLPTRSGEDFVKILDFGISKYTAGPLAQATMTGAVLGSPCYMSPEQARGLRDIDPRTDLYAVGAVLYECLTGRTPFDGDNFNDLMFQIVTAPRPNPLQYRPDLSPALLPIISRALSIEPKDRFASADEFRAALLGWLETQGATAGYAPELHRWMKATPPGEGAVRALDPSDKADRGRTPLQGSNPTARPLASTGLAGETPLASSATQKDAPRSRRALAYVGAGAFVALLAAGGFAAFRGHIFGRNASIGDRAAGGAATSAPSAPNAPAPPPAGDTDGPKPSTAPAATVRNGLVELTVKATPPFAKLFLDGVPLTGNPSVGQYGRDDQLHSLRAEAPRYVTKTTTVVFDKPARVVDVTLERVPPPPPPRPTVNKETPSAAPPG